MKNDIVELREHLFDTLRGLKNKTVELDQARAICEVAKNITETAKVECDFLRVTEGYEGTGFVPADGATKTIKAPNGDITTTKVFPGMTLTQHKTK